MAQGKQTPRQKMINLMYLVFIAMMALNIDAEIIRSYYDSTQSLKATRELTEDKNTNIFEKTLEAKSVAVPDTYAQPWQQYQQLKLKVDALVTHAEGIKSKLKKDSEFFDVNPKTKKPVDISENFAALNNNEATTTYFFSDGDENKASAGAKDLMAKMNDVRNYINQTFGNQPALQKLVQRANDALKTEYKGTSPTGKPWIQSKFYHQPLIAALSNLEIIQNDARNVQSDALALMLQEKVDANIKFNMYDAVVKAPIDIIMGTPAEATVYLASYSNSNKININGVARQENGKGFVGLNTSSLGPKTISGSISVATADGKVENIPYTHTYNVIAGPHKETEIVKFETGALVSADKMNVMYRGLDNPISGSILGVDNSRLSLSASGATVRGAGPGKWIVTPGATGVVKLTISGNGPRGNQSKTFDFRVKPVPPPQGQVRGRSSLSVPATSIPNQVVSAALPDFDFPVSFNVTRFMFKIPGRAAIPVTGNSLNAVAGAVKTLRPGDQVAIYGIEYTVSGITMAAGREASPVIINVQ